MAEVLGGGRGAPGLVQGFSQQVKGFGFAVPVADVAPDGYATLGLVPLRLFESENRQRATLSP